MQTQEPVVALLQPSGGLLLKLAASGECLVYLTRARLNRVMPPLHHMVARVLNQAGRMQDGDFSTDRL